MPIRLLILFLFLLTLNAAPVAACFGPKLYLGAESGAQGEVLFALVSLYVKEKTGTESVRVDLDGKDPLAELRADKVDLIFWGGVVPVEPVVLRIDGLPLLISGPRPLEDLQFTLVAPALKKLGRLLTAEQVMELADQVSQGAPPAASARRFLMSQGWI